MKFLEFKQSFSKFNAITYQEIRNVFDSVNKVQLFQWKKKGYLKSVKKGMFVLADKQTDVFLLANELNSSYISLETALSYYQIIPEATQIFISVSKDRQEKIENDFGSFYYHKITPQLFTGFILIDSEIKQGRKIKIATPTKALFDLIYFRIDMRTIDDFDSLRLNLDKIKISEFKKYTKYVKMSRIKKRLDEFIKYYDRISRD